MPTDRPEWHPPSAPAPKNESISIPLPPSVTNPNNISHSSSTPLPDHHQSIHQEQLHQSTNSTSTPSTSTNITTTANSPASDSIPLAPTPTPTLVVMPTSPTYAETADTHLTSTTLHSSNDSTNNNYNNYNISNNNNNYYQQQRQQRQVQQQEQEQQQRQQQQNHRASAERPSGVPRCIVRIDRDHDAGDEATRFEAELFPIEFVGRVTRPEFKTTVQGINECMRVAEESMLNCLDTLLDCLTAYTAKYCCGTHYQRSMRKMEMFIDMENERTYHPARIHLRDPQKVGMIYLEFEVF